MKSIVTWYIVLYCVANIKDDYKDDYNNKKNWINPCPAELFQLYF